MDSITACITGGIIGGAYGIVGYLKNEDKKKEFNWWKIAPTVILSAAAGLIIGSSGALPDDATLAITVSSMTALGVDRALETLFKLLKQKIIA